MQKKILNTMQSCLRHTSVNDVMKRNKPIITKVQQYIGLNKLK